MNITAGLDLSLGEFSEVGETIEDIASEDATVVVGTVIDPDMTDSLKVTVVATGLRNAEARPTLTTVEPTVTARPRHRVLTMRTTICHPVSGVRLRRQWMVRLPSN